MKHLDLLNKTITSVIFSLEVKKQELNESDQYVNGMYAGAKMVQSIVQAWQIEMPDYISEHLEYLISKEDDKKVN